MIWLVMIDVAFFSARWHTVCMYSTAKAGADLANNRFHRDSLEHRVKRIERPLEPSDAI